METQAIPELVNSLCEEFNFLSSKKEVFLKMENELKEEYDKDKQLKSFFSLTKTWVKVLVLWGEQGEKIVQDVDVIKQLIQKYEESEVVDLKEFNMIFGDYINQLPFLALFAFEIEKFEDLLSNSQYDERISRDYLDNIKKLLEKVQKLKNFLGVSQRSAKDHKYFHLRYGLQLKDKSQIKEIKDMEKEFLTLRDGEFEIPEDFQASVIQKLVDDYSGEPFEQETIIRRIKSQDPRLNTEFSTDRIKAPTKFNEGPPLVDF